MLSNRHLHICRAILTIAMVSLFGGATLAQSPVRETVSFPREYRAKQIQVSGTLLLPPGTGKVPAMVIQHGSGGVTEGREFRYANDMVALGVASFVIDSFKPRGITSTVTDQLQVTVNEIADDALNALKALAAHPRIDANKVGIVGFSKGGSVTLRTALERAAARVLPPGVRFALHVPVYPGCDSHYYRPKLTGAPIYMLLGGADTYAGVTPCTEYAEKLKAAGAAIEVKIYPGASHGFDTDGSYTVPKGENWSKCIFEEQPDFTWKERTSGAITTDKQGRLIAEGHAKAIAACRTYGISGGFNAAAKAASTADLKAAVTKHLLGK